MNSFIDSSLVRRGIISAVIALTISPAADSSAFYKCRPETPYYFDEFSPASWSPDKELNYEEVYRNYEYFEVLFDKGCAGIVVKRYVKGQFSSSDRYRVNNDGTLEKIRSGQ